MMDVLVPETCWGNKTAYFVASSWFFTFTMSKMRGHMNIKPIRPYARINLSLSPQSTFHPSWHPISYIYFPSSPFQCIYATFINSSATLPTTYRAFITIDYGNMFFVRITLRIWTPCIVHSKQVTNTVTHMISVFRRGVNEILILL
jgi:hypothetical protein